ncbi:hypothetical protein M3Y99_00488800 [Aphelenchoides fujianensis]|nr:hypothetical protein M3Y99_00488800 [Aphelenchoides fujianensis]
MKCLNLMFWPLLWSLVILSALNGFVHWDLPPELQLPSFVFTTIGGFPSLYGYQRRLGNDADGWKQWLENLTETANGRFSQVNLALTHRKAPICSLTKSSADTCHTHSVASCESAEDQRCAAAWFADDRHVQCARDDGTPLDCQTNGYNVHSVHSSPGYLLLILRAAPADPVATTNYVAKSSDCGIYLSKNDSTSILTIPDPR